MVTAPVGFHCPPCVRAAPGVHTLRDTRPAATVTVVLIALNAAAFLPALGGAGAAIGSANPLARDFALVGPAVAEGEWWRLVASGFLHYGIVHIGFNMVILYQLGLMLEPALGRLRFATLYLTALLGGAFGALVLQPEAFTAGASGAVFGLMGAAVVGMRHRGVDPTQSGIPALLAINLVLTFAIPGISIGGHLGGLAGGAAAGAVLFATEGPGATRRATGVAGCVLIAAAAVAGSLITATTPLVPMLG
ncbi:MAG: rhomboid family intramembrane serine protease [Acidimicrobiales bacterium]